MVIALFCMNIAISAQNISLKMNNVTVKQAINELKEKTGYSFLFESGDLNTQKNISVNANDINSAIKQIIVGQNVSFTIKNKEIIVQKRTDKTNNDIKKNPKHHISGIITDAKGEPIIGANIMEKGSNTGTISDINGYFNLNMENNTKIVVSYTGFNKQEVSVAGKDNIKIILKESNESLDELIVIGYGTIKKTDLTGAASTLKASSITANVTGNVLESLQGKASGVAVFNDNRPGSAPSIRVRGSGSISASNEPLYVVDGFPLMDGDISDINSNDIESIEILKDASSTAIYGSRGANGVVMITTKKGSEGTNHLSFNSQFGVQNAGRLLNNISGDDFINFMNAGYTNQGSKAPFTSTNIDASTNWEKEILSSSATLQNYNAIYDGGNKNTKYMLSLGYFDQNGLLKGQGYQKYSFHSNIQHKFNSWLTFGANIQYTYSLKDNYNEGMVSISRYGWPTEPIKNENNSYNIASLHNTYLNDAWNPINDMNEITNATTNSRVLSTAFAEINFCKDLKYRMQIGVDLKNSRNYQYSTSNTASNIAANKKGSGSNTWYKDLSDIIENQLTYSHQWDKHRLTATGVYSWQKYTFENTGLSGSGFENDETEAWDMGLADKESVNWNSTKYSNTLISFTGRISYAYSDKYLLTVTSRWDGSSRFGANNKWGFFPSIGAAWRISQEKFLMENRIITDLKIRSSYGITGNQEIGNYKSLAQLLSANYTDTKNLVTGFYESIGNPNLKWERTNQYDFGFDLGLFSRLNINFDYYKRHTKNLLYDVPIPSTSGFSSILSNIGEVQNNGWELTVGGNIVKKKDWSVDASFNMTYNNNRINKLYGNVEEVTVKAGNTGINKVLKVGNPVDAIYARHSLGIIKTQEQLDAYKQTVPNTAANAKLGDEMYEDLDGDGSITSKDFICLGSVQPKYFYGINISTNYKKISFSIYGQGGYKYASITGDEDYYTNGTAYALGYGNLSSYMLYGENQLLNNVYIPTQYAYDHMWSEANPDGTYPAAGAHNVYLSDRTNANWNYFILKNIQFTYDFTSLINIQTLKKFEATLNLQNFVTFANHRGYNPINGDTSSPWAKSVIIGLNIKF